MRCSSHSFCFQRFGLRPCGFAFAIEGIHWTPCIFTLSYMFLTARFDAGLAAAWRNTAGGVPHTRYLQGGGGFGSGSGLDAFTVVVCPCTLPPMLWGGQCLLGPVRPHAATTAANDAPSFFGKKDRPRLPPHRHWLLQPPSISLQPPSGSLQRPSGV